VTEGPMLKHAKVEANQELDMANTYVVVPVFNEATVIESVIETLRDYFPNIVTINDGSSDSTRAVLHQLPVVSLNHLINLGQGAALQTGINYALSQGAKWIITFDSDGQHKPEDAYNMLATLQQGDSCDVVIGSKP